MNSAATPSPIASATRDAHTLLAFDYGAKRIGVAVGDARLRSAHPLAVIAAAGAARRAALDRVIEEWRPARLIVGLPCTDDGTPHPLAARVRHFVRELEGRYRRAVALVDERYSSVEAEARLREAAGARRAARASRDREIDSYAAQLLLEQYLDDHPA
ncbi:MAG: Holliday junction resolvase RuvX [Betaproteobacteria bacterium]|nr:Holliday junction resolvase RuvX [Betaproteobacteria bacterium]